VIIMTSNLGIRDVNQAGTSLGFQPAVVDEADEGVAGVGDGDAFADAGRAQVFAGFEGLEQCFEEPFLARVENQGA
jgi:hypothetical protein